MTNTKQELIAIRDGAPDVTATHELGGYYYRCHAGSIEKFASGQWSLGFLPYMVHHLSDITAQIELMEQNEKLKARVAGLKIDASGERLRISKQKEIIKMQHESITELEREISEFKAVNEYLHVLDNGDVVKPTDALAKLKLEQHEENTVNFCAWLVDNGEPIPEESMLKYGCDYINQLRNSAKGES